MRCAFLFIMSAATLLTGTNFALAASLSNQGASVSGNGFGDSGSSAGPNTVRAADSFIDDRFNRSAEAISRADIGSLAGYARATIAPASFPASGTSGANASGSFLLDGIVVTRLPGFEGLPSTVETTARLTFDPGSTFEEISTLSGGLSGGTAFALGGLSSASPTATSTATLMVGQSYTLNAAVQMSVGVQGVFETKVASYHATLDPFEAFIVPEGYVVNAPDGHIVDNVYVGPSGPVVGGIDGDYNFDGLIDAADYTVWRDALDNGTDLPNDTTPDDVTAADYDLWAANYGGPVASLAIPEPTGATLLATFALAASFARFSCPLRAFRSRSAPCRPRPR